MDKLNRNSVNSFEGSITGGESTCESLEVVDPIIETAQKTFGIKYLYPWQRLVIANILDAFEINSRNCGNQKINPENTEVVENTDGTDSTDIENNGRQIVLLPTGAGKSLCFMVPAMLLPGATLVLYPLLALMTDQMRRMEEGGIPMAVFRGQQDEKTRQENFDKIEQGARIILANPEVLQSESLVKRLASCNISHIAIDEAHCVSEWGDTFRPAYLTLGDIIKKLKVPVVTAFTATASPEVLKRVADVLFDGDVHIVRSESDRPNILYNVIPCYAKQKMALLLTKQVERPMIIFCSSRKRTESLARELRAFLGENDTVRFYHAGLEKAEKEATEQWFYPKKDAILVATCAFGMGVDKKNIRTVIHLDPPTTAEAYIQEAGRGGRDGENANAYLLWSYNDSEKGHSFAIGSRSRVMADFAEATSCRRQVLLDALGAEKAVCSGCDICNGTAEREAEDANFVYHFIRRHRKSLSTYEALESVRRSLNYESARLYNMNVWTENDLQEIFSQLEKEEKVRVLKFPWKGRVDINKKGRKPESSVNNA